jgi:thioredoxin
MAVINLTELNFEDEVMRSDKPVLIDFFANWCGPCRMVSPLVDEIADERDDVKVCKVDVDDQGELAAHFGVSQVAPNSHLFTSDRLVPDFPGRQFVIEAVTTMNKRELRQHLQGITQANIAVRNFPLTAADLRRRLKLADGGPTYIFATTLADNTHVLLVCRKAVFV